MASLKQIVVRGTPINKEGIATETITPGDLLDIVTGSAATGGTYKTPYLKKHAISQGNATRMWALEQDYIGSVPPTTAIAKTYANGDTVRYGSFRPGDELMARLAASQNVAFGDYLSSNGDGTLKLATLGSPGNAFYVVARSLEASNVGTVARIVVEVL